MALHVICDVHGCKKGFDKSGALVVSKKVRGKSRKYHVCPKCWEEKLKPSFSAFRKGRDQATRNGPELFSPQDARGMVMRQGISLMRYQSLQRRLFSSYPE